jgi:hypothetical protein
MPITFNRPRRGWAAVRWQTGDYDKIAAQLQALAPVPGVRLFEQEDGGLMEVPQSAFALEAWHELARRHMKTTRVFEPTFYPPVQPLYPHQAAAAMWLSGKSGGLLADPMGLGKTRSAIAAAETIAQAEGPHRARLIIAPGYTRDVWLRELLACGAIESEDDFCAVFTRNPQDESFQPKRARWWFIHYDVVHAWSPTLEPDPGDQPAGPTRRRHPRRGTLDQERPRPALQGRRSGCRCRERTHPADGHPAGQPAERAVAPADRARRAA